MNADRLFCIFIILVSAPNVNPDGKIGHRSFERKIDPQKPSPIGSMDPIGLDLFFRSLRKTDGFRQR